MAAAAKKQTIRKQVAERERRGLLSATPERMAKSGSDMETQALSEPDPGKESGPAVEVQRLADWPLERLYKAGILNGADGSRNERQYVGDLRREAGELYYRHWYYGRTFPLGSRDYRQPYSGASTDPYSIAPSQERSQYHRDRFRDAEARLGSDRVARVTRAIVIDEKEPVEVGRVVTGRNDQTAARAVAIEYLIDGLDRLRGLWDMNA